MIGLTFINQTAPDIRKQQRIQGIREKSLRVNDKKLSNKDRKKKKAGERLKKQTLNLAKIPLTVTAKAEDCRRHLKEMASRERGKGGQRGLKIKNALLGKQLMCLL